MFTCRLTGCYSFTHIIYHAEFLCLVAGLCFCFCELMSCDDDIVFSKRKGCSEANTTKLLRGTSRTDMSWLQVATISLASRSHTLLCVHTFTHTYAVLIKLK